MNPEASEQLSREQVYLDLREAATEILEDKMGKFELDTKLGTETIDSIDMLEILMILEDKYEVELTNETELLTDVSSLVDHIVRLANDVD